MSKTTIRLTGPALEAARGVHRLHLEAHAKKEELLTAAGLPEEDLGKWQLPDRPWLQAAASVRH